MASSSSAVAAVPFPRTLFAFCFLVIDSLDARSISPPTSPIHLITRALTAPKSPCIRAPGKLTLQVGSKFEWSALETGDPGKLLQGDTLECRNAPTQQEGVSVWPQRSGRDISPSV